MNFPSSGTIMKTQRFLRTLAAAVLLGAPVSSLAQGPLTPPGPPAPMMKTLVEMEPRTHIVSLPFTITAPGSYYLTTNLNGGGSSTGIVIQANGVTIDLRGFAIENCTSGITASATGIKEVAIHNGGVRGCAGTGIDLAGVSKIRLENLMLSDNGGDGASVGEASLVTLCTAKGNGGNGIVLGSSGKVFQCMSQSNGGSGISVASSCQIADNNCNNNGSGAGLVTIGDGNRVEGNSSNQNKFGFLVNGTANLVIRNNACSNTTADYSVSTGNNYGQVLVSPGAAFASSNAWANFGCGTPGGIACGTAADCDDGDACTTDVCQAAVCINTPIPDCGLTCATSADCDDANACTTDVCQAGSCSHTAAPNGTACTDGNACSQGDVCISGTCSGGGSLVCNDSNPCTTDSCNAASGCTYTAIPGCGGSCINGSTQACYGGPAGTSGVGVCQTGVQTCSGGAWGACLGSVTPATEICDGTDNDCDGMVDEGLSCGAICGDGIVQVGESCDDGNFTNGDGCTATCSVQIGYSCAGSPSVCSSICGDGLVTSSESCDDGNNVGGDGCTASCSVESGFNCAGSPSVCTAINYPLNTSMTGTGSGTVTSAPTGINCGADCTETYSSGTLVSLSAAAQSGSFFAGWSGGGCSGTGTCAVTMNSATTVSAMFTLSTYPLTVTKAGLGSGTVTSSPAGINCGATCTGNYNHGTNVTLTAAAQAGSSFVGWSGGGCSGIGTCVTTMSSAKTVIATFN